MMGVAEEESEISIARSSRPLYASNSGRSVDAARAQTLIC